ncbi:hypothetical protein [Actinospica robiniae]|uniref:hypothetical protein n=1 Tax=Actinospica robiniae TaxID=304901 RepID=UPI0003F4B095|nr:hypothetical protein [Actinospica robiniae]
MYTGIVGVELAGVFAGAPPLPVFVGVADRVALGVADCVALGVADPDRVALGVGAVLTPEGETVADTVGHGLALTEAVAGVLGSFGALAPSSPDGELSAELESVAPAEADAVSEGVSEVPAVGVLEQAGEEESASAETGSTSEVP